MRPLTSIIKRRLLAALFFGWLVALLALTYWPNLGAGNPPDKGLRTDYIGHFGFYAVLIVFFLLWQRFRGKKISTGYILQVALVGILLGALTEFTQQLVPGRSLNPLDMLFNCTGIVAGALAFAVIWRKSLATYSA